MSTATEPRFATNPTVPGATPASETPSVTERAKEMAAGTVESVKSAAEHQLEKLRGTAEEYYGQGKEKAVELGHEVERYVRREPAKSLAIAAGVGFVVGFLLIRR